MYPSRIKLAVKKNKAHVGISFDGDADRIIMCDERGKIINGDGNYSYVSYKMEKEKNT